ncbi:MAG TPA: glycosyltransferase [Candidatus Bacteroides avicola]|uniref:Glycosyltransferase n=1 Tax=Candidatus Bacteroides avicola TaxID=2838468 RepID=A0A9D2KUM1_9BACE|nr:glycosyltransferase [Candidatus Bacteroides avicola]
MEAFTFDKNETLLLATLGGLLLIQALYYACLYLRIPRHAKAARQGDISFATEYPPLSVVIYAREACEYLRANLTSILSQDYPRFEVIVITDGTDDGTADYLTQLRESYPHLYHSFVPNSSRYISHKKLGLTLGIRAAKYDWLVMTEPDCHPESNQWLRLLARNFTPSTQIVLGHVGYARGKGWLHKRIAYDNLFQAIRYLGFALGGHPYMGLGGNLAYRKELFYQNKGFSEYLNLVRGDDDLFINQVAMGENTRVEIDTASVVRRTPCARAKDWREEKIGYASTARFYKGTQRYAAGLETLTRLLFHLSWLTALVMGILLQQWLMAAMALTAFFLRLALQLYVINHNARALGEERRYYFTLPVFDLLQPLQSLRWKLCCAFRNKSEFMRK